MSKPTTSGVAARNFRLAGKDIEKGDPVILPASQFDDLRGVGLVDESPAAVAAAKRRKPRKSKAKARPKATAPVEVGADTVTQPPATEPEASEAAPPTSAGAGGQA